MVGSTLYLTWTETGKIYFRTLNTASKVWSSAVRIDPTTPAATIQQQSRVVSNGATTPVPYVTYTECDPACKVWVKKWNAAAWEAVGGSLNVDPTRSAQDSAIVFDGRNPPVPYVIWTEADASGVMQIFVKRFDAASSSWILVGGGSLTVNPVVLNVGGQNPSIAIGGFTIKAAWAECTSADCELYVKRLEADTWLPASPTSLKVGHLSVAPKPNDPSLAFINDGLNNTLYLAWHENIAFYVKKENPDGSFTSVGTIPDSPSSSSGISFGGTASAAQVPYIVFADSTNPATKIFVNRWNGTGWVTEGNGALNMTHGGSQPSTVDSSIAFLQGTPYVAWSERGACIVPLTSPPGSPFTVCGQNNSSSYQIYVKRLE